MRLAAGLEYEGTAYAGWQAQGHARGVQSEVERALGQVADHAVVVHCAGRTDAGVHALGQVIHFDTDAKRDEDAWLLGGNSHLPADVSLRWIRKVSGDFHARHDALSRRYRYLIHNSRSRSGLFAHRASRCSHPLDAGRMHEAAQCLVGEHDFSAYRASECQSRTPNRRIIEIAVTRAGEWLVVEVEANAFLHHMVRNIVGVLLAIGRGQQPLAWAREVLESRDRRLAGVTAAPEGLYFLFARYDARHGLPQPATPDSAPFVV